MTSEVNVAVERFKSGCACSQAVCGTYGPRYGLDEDQGMRIAAAFAGGMRIAETCGAVTGALMVLGLAHCSESCRTAEERKPAYAAALTFFEQFKKRHGSLSCSDATSALRRARRQRASRVCSARSASTWCATHRQSSRTCCRALRRNRRYGSR